MAGNRKDSPVAGKRDLKRQILARWQLYLLLLLPLIYIAVFACLLYTSPSPRDA